MKSPIFYSKSGFYRGSAAAFSLLELLSVILIISIFAAMLGPVLTSISMGSSVTRAGEMISDTLKEAHLYAIGHNHAVEVRFYKYKDDSSSVESFRGIQIFEVTGFDETSTKREYRPLSKFMRLPRGVVMVATGNDGGVYSTLLDNSLISDNPDNTPIPAIGRNKSYIYTRFSFRADGGTDLNDLTSSITTFYVTVAKDSQFSSEKIKNFYTIQVDPVDSRVTMLRP